MFLVALSCSSGQHQCGYLVRGSPGLWESLACLPSQNTLLLPQPPLCCVGAAYHSRPSLPFSLSRQEACTPLYALCAGEHSPTSHMQSLSCYFRSNTEQRLFLQVRKNWALGEVLLFHLWGTPPHLFWDFLFLSFSPDIPCSLSHEEDSKISRLVTLLQVLLFALAFWTLTILSDGDGWARSHCPSSINFQHILNG